MSEKQTDIIKTSSKLLLWPADTTGPLVGQNARLVDGKTVRAEQMQLGNEWVVIPEGRVGQLPDTSWDRRGESVTLPAGSRVRLVEHGSAYRLATVEVETVAGAWNKDTDLSWLPNQGAGIDARLARKDKVTA